MEEFGKEKERVVSPELVAHIFRATHYFSAWKKYDFKQLRMVLENY